MMRRLMSLTYGVVVGRDVPVIEQVVERFFVRGSEEPNKSGNFVFLHTSKKFHTCLRHKCVERRISRPLGSLVRDVIQRPLNVAA